MFYSQGFVASDTVEEDLTTLNIRESIQKTRQALDIAYAGFDNALDEELIDSYIYEIIALQKRYNHLVELASSEPAPQPVLCQHSPIRALVSHVFS